MMKFFLDTYALIEISRGSKNFEEYLDSKAVTLKGNLAEMYYILLREYNQKTADKFLTLFSRIVRELPISVISKAMIFRLYHRKKKLSYVDCISYVYARDQKYVFLTGDRAFKDMDNVKLVR